MSFERNATLDGMYCYNASDRISGAFLTLKKVLRRDVCEQICASDPSCVAYGWYGSDNSTALSRCYQCAFYRDCEFQRVSVCQDVAVPLNYFKATNASIDAPTKSYAQQEQLLCRRCVTCYIFKGT